MQYDDFKETFMKTLDQHASVKKKTVTANNAPFMNKILSKEFMHRSKIKNIIKVNSEFSLWRELKCGVPQQSILGPLLFNIFINDILLFISDAKIANYADDNSTYSIKENI